MANKIYYNKDLLLEICDRDKCIIDFVKIEKYNMNTRIKFICNCGIEYSKTFILLYKSAGAFCKKCTENIRQEKKKQTCLEKYGVENPSQLQEVKDKSKQTCMERYGVAYSLQSQEVKNKSKQTCLDRYGVEHPLQLQEVRDKIKQSCINIYGVENPSQSQEIKNKKKDTTILNYGVENPSQSQEIKNKKKDTTILNYGVENPSQSQEIKNKKIDTTILNYGVENPSQNAEISEKQSKNSYKLKEFNFPCGKTILVQGYEPFLLKYLVEGGYTHEDIITKRADVPEIWYDEDNKKHRYYCDAYIPKINTIYEVKSTWTYEIAKEKNILKQQACIDAGYLYVLCVYNNKSILQEENIKIDNI
jgi:hypothetical protein